MTQRIGLVSDLHLEFGAWDRQLGEGNILFVAGDMNVAAQIYAAKSHGQTEYFDRSVKFYDHAFTRFDHVVGVMGNHEHYNGVANLSKAVLLDAFGHYSRLHLLEKESIEINGLNIFGATFWTDFNRNDWATKQRAKDYMNDYRIIKVEDEAGNQVRLHPEHTYEEHIQTLHELDQTIKGLGGKPLVVVSHMGPSKKSVHPKYGDALINGAYSSNLEHYMMPECNIPLWVHGHTHDSHDYRVCHTRVVCNPRGYVGHALNPKFKPDLVLEV